MRTRLHRGSDSAEVSMTPMLDIVFILLIFFIVTATILQEEGLEMLGRESDGPPRPVESILVQVDRNNAVFVNGRLTDPARVAAAIQRQNVDNGGRGAVVIQPDPDAEHGMVTRVFDSARAARVANVLVSAPSGWANDVRRRSAACATPPAQRFGMNRGFLSRAAEMSAMISPTGKISVNVIGTRDRGSA